MSTLVLPDPSLVILVGAAGSGKSTLAARLFALDEIVSSDALRAAVSGNEADQTASAVAFRILHRTVERRLAEGELTVVDATNTKAEHRRPLISRARITETPTIAIVLDLPASTVNAQNAGRSERVVNPDVVERHLAAIRRTVDQGHLTAEGFDHVVLLQTRADADNLRIDRTTAAGGAGRRPAEGASGAAP
jgi:protein phosphatase